MQRWIGRVFVCGAVLFMAGCSEPPVKEHDAAVAAIAAAKSDGAALYAADDLAAAETALKHYDEFVAQRDYKQALGSALDARDRAVDAAHTTTSKRASLQTEAAALQKTLEAAVAGIDTQLKTPRAKGARSAVALRQTRKAATTAMQEARKDLDAGRLLEAVKRLVAANADVNRDSSSAEDATKKARK